MTDPSLLSLGDERFVSLSTYRRSGQPVAVPVWIAHHDGALVVTTTPSSGKVKRLRHDARVALQPCNRRGTVAPGAPTAHGRAEILDAPQDVAPAMATIRAKYGVEYHLIRLAERVARRGRLSERVILRLTPAEALAGDAAPGG